MLADDSIPDKDLRALLSTICRKVKTWKRWAKNKNALLKIKSPAPIRQKNWVKPTVIPSSSNKNHLKYGGGKEGQTGLAVQPHLWWRFCT